MIVGQKERQLIMVIDLGEGQRGLERISVPQTRRKGRRRYPYKERNQSLKAWWDRNEMSTLVSLEVMAYEQKRAAQIAELSNQSTEFFSHLTSEDASATKLIRAFLDANFQPITLYEIARKLRTERLRIESDLQGRGQWVGKAFDYLVDGILADEDRGAKPMLTKERKSKLKEYIRGDSLTFD